MNYFMAKAKAVVKKVTKKKAAIVCDTCDGRGLQDANNLCPICEGTGVVHS